MVLFVIAGEFSSESISRPTSMKSALLHFPKSSDFIVMNGRSKPIPLSQDVLGYRSTTGMDGRSRTTN